MKYNLNQVSVENSELKAKVSHLKTDAVHLRVAKRAMEAKVEADKLVVILFHSFILSFIHSFIHYIPVCEWVLHHGTRVNIL